MYTHIPTNPEDQMFEALAAVFALEAPVALDLSKQAACQIALFYADIGATSGSSAAIEVALEKIHEMQVELFALEGQLRDFKEQSRFRQH